ncbi:MAG: 3-hydroxyacyl-CoA dehydrogenase family protein [Deltaproteobacteria bacterium]|nr:3-hydroxyacyl-CoA dehydrogenase family protein [Deltaproteobacteria bacterium]
MRKIGVIGAGTMGGGIAQVFALHGYQVTLVDIDETVLKAALGRIKEHTRPELWDKVSGMIATTTDMADVKEADLVVEAVLEDMAVKKKVFKALSGICRKDAIIATNTSALSVNELARSVDNPARFAGMHFMNPPKVMLLVEVIKGDETSGETVAAVMEAAGSIEKVTALTNDSPGFISNRLLFALIGEALRLLESGAAKKEDIDIVMKFGMNHPMGPIELADFIGLDVCKEIMTTLYDGLKDERYKPTAMLDALVKEGKLGRKTKEGFYRYA